MKLLALLVLLVAPASAFPVRVYYKPNGKVIVLQAVACQDGEMPQACLERVAAKDCPRDDAGTCLPSDDMDSSALPSRETRNQWRGNKSTKLRVDTSYKTQKQRIAEAEASMDEELAKQNADPVKVIKAQRDLEKARREKDRP
jgi:hypothetical protein